MESQRSQSARHPCVVSGASPLAMTQTKRKKGKGKGKGKGKAAAGGKPSAGTDRLETSFISKPCVAETLHPAVLLYLFTTSTALQSTASSKTPALPWLRSLLPMLMYTPRARTAVGGWGDRVAVGASALGG